MSTKVRYPMKQFFISLAIIIDKSNVNLTPFLPNDLAVQTHFSSQSNLQCVFHRYPSHLVHKLIHDLISFLLTAVCCVYLKKIYQISTYASN